MKTSALTLIPALALLMGAATPLHALDFTLHRTAMSNGIGMVPKAYFMDGDSKIFLEIPLDWQVSDSPQALDGLPKRANCRVRIEQAGNKPWAFDDASKVILRKRALNSIPGGAKDVVAVPEQTDLIPLAGWSTLEVAHSYEFFGQKMRRSVLYANLPEHRVWQITVTTPEADFAAIHEQTRLMLYNLFEPTRMLSPAALQRYNDGITD